MNDTMQDAGLGVPTEAEKKLASDFAKLEGAKAMRLDRWVNWGFTLLIVAFGVVAVFA